MKRMLLNALVAAALVLSAGVASAAEKVTYPALFGIDESLRRADQLIESAFSALDGFGPGARTLKELARFLVERKN